MRSCWSSCSSYLHGRHVMVEVLNVRPKRTVALAMESVNLVQMDVLVLDAIVSMTVGMDTGEVRLVTDV